MDRVNIQDAKTHLSRYAKKVKNGQTVILCERNIPIAEIRPIEQKMEYPEPSQKQLIIREAKEKNEVSQLIGIRNTCVLTDSELMDRLNREKLRSGISLEKLVKNVIEVGLSHLASPQSSKSYRTQPQAMGLKESYSYDNIGELLAKADGEDYK